MQKLSLVHNQPESERIHGSVQPENIRGGNVISVQALEVDGKQAPAGQFRLWSISPLGVEILYHGDVAAMLKLGVHVAVKIAYQGKTLEHKGLVVEVDYEIAGKGRVLGVRWVNTAPTANPLEEKRGTKRWLSGTGFLPTGVCPNPLRYNDYMYFNVMDISANGLKLKTSLRNKMIVPGMTFEGMFSFPMAGQVKLNFRVVRCAVEQDDGKDILALGCELLAATKAVREVFAQYLLQFGEGVFPDELRQDGLEPRSICAGVTFSNVRSESDYQKVLELRRLAWLSTKKVDEAVKAEFFSDIHDTRARIVTASHHGQVVASLRMLFPDDEHALEHSHYTKIPDDVPRKDEMVEVTRVVVHPQYRKNDLLYTLLNHAGCIALQSGRRYILGNSDKSLLPLYDKLGATILDAPFANPKLGVDGKLFLFDLHKVVAGIGVSPLMWGAVYRDAARFLTRSDIVSVGPFSALRMAFYSAIAPLAPFLMQLKAKTKKSREHSQITAADAKPSNMDVAKEKDRLAS